MQALLLIVMGSLFLLPAALYWLQMICSVAVASLPSFFRFLSSIPRLGTYSSAGHPDIQRRPFLLPCIDQFQRACRA